MVVRNKRTLTVAIGALAGVVAIAAVTSTALIAHGDDSKSHAAASLGASNPVQFTSGPGAFNQPNQTGNGHSDQQGSAAYLGVNVMDSNGKLQVASVVGGGPADGAGIKQNDSITAIDGTAIATGADLRNALATKKPGDAVTVSVDRSGAKQDIKVTLGTAPQRQNPSATAASGRGYLGISVQNVDDAAKQKYNLNTSDGALITLVQPGGAADKAGLKAGDLITSVNGKPIKTIDDLTGALNGTKSGDSATIQYTRGTASQSATVTLGDGQSANGGFPGFGGNARRGSGPGGNQGGNGGPSGNGGAGGINIPGLGGIGAAIDKNFDRFVSNETKTKDSNGAVHTDTTVGGVVKGDPSNNQVTVTLNGGGEATFTTDSNTKIRKGLSGSQSNVLAKDDKVLVTTRDGSNTATAIIVVNANGFLGSLIGDLGNAIGATQGGANDNSANDNDNNRANGSAGGDATSGGSSPAQPGDNGIHIRIPGGQDITVPVPGGNLQRKPGGNSGPTY